MKIGVRRCVATKTVQTAAGPAQRCARYEETGVDVEHRGSFGDFANLLKWNMSFTDLLLGGAAGFFSTGAVKFGINKLLPVSISAKLPPFLLRAAPVLGGALAGSVLYFAQVKSNPDRARAHAASAVGVGVAVTVWDMLKAQFPALSEAWTYSLPYAGYGLIQPEAEQRSFPGQYGYAALISDPRPGMAQLAAMHNEDDAP